MANTNRCDYVNDETGRVCGKLVKAGAHQCATHGQGEKTMAEPESGPSNPTSSLDDAVRQAAGLPAPSRAAPSTKPKFAPMTAGQQATDMASQLWARQQAEVIQRQKARADRRKREGKRERAPLTAFPNLPDLPKPLEMKDQYGSEWGTPGWYKRWVSSVGPDGKPNQIHVRRFQAMGGRFITNKQADPDYDGPNPDQPHKDYKLFAMECPMENRAAYILQESPPGAYSHDWDIDHLETMIDAESSRLGRRPANLVVGEGHGDRSA